VGIEPLLDLTEYSFSAVVDGDDVPGTLCPDKFLFRAAERFQGKLRYLRRTAGIFAGLNYQSGGSDVREYLPGTADNSRQFV
jgi:hypothetical protein